MYVVDEAAFEFVVDGDRDEILDAALLRYEGYIFSNDWNASSLSSSTAATISSLVIQVRDVNVELQLGVDESYVLEINPANDEVAVLRANTTWGALHGLESFSQLIWTDFEAQTYTLPYGPYHIIDHPRFPHRGILIDTSRHFLPVDTIKRVISALEASKMNVFHWHIVDTQSFPAEILAFPGLTDNGAWSRKEVYSQEDLRDVVEYARERGVRVIPEFDIPGHTLSWQGASDEVDIVTCHPPNPYGYNGQLDPTLEVTYDVIDAILTEMRAIFTDHFFHFGYDEIREKCWTETPHIAQFMEDNEFKTYIDLLQYFTDRVLTMNDNEKTAVFWEEAFLENIDLSHADNSIIQVWIDFDVMYDALKAGRKVILSNSQAVYLDCIGDEAVGYLMGHTWCTYNSWEEIYLNEPFPEKGRGKRIDEYLQANLLGGETAMWGERTDETNVEGRTFPRTSAYGERLWSNKDVTDLVEAKYRIIRHRCHLRTRGVLAEPIVPSNLGTESCAFMISGANFHNDQRA